MKCHISSIHGVKSMKRGYVREDGMVYARMLDGKPLWLTREQYDKREVARKKYVKECFAMYKRRRQCVRKIGEYDHRRNLYFVGVSSSGKEVWRGRAFYERFIDKVKRSKSRYNQRCKDLPPTDLVIGSPHPTKPGIFVTNKVGNKCFFGNKAKLQKRLESIRMAYTKRHYKAKKRRALALEGIVRKRRGETRLEDSKIFFEYDRIGKEIWLDPVEFHRRRNKDCERRRQYRKLRKQKTCQESNSQASSPLHSVDLLSLSTTGSSCLSREETMSSATSAQGS